ncbi:uncharacterized protein [Dermacentor andersoni]|uniref:uncharacterized protein isoform X2 n=1 Tax=Dermacentor andersoni TaxID=34620 RepID=UPI003B3A2415
MAILVYILTTLNLGAFISGTLAITLHPDVRSCSEPQLALDFTAVVARTLRQRPWFAIHMTRPPYHRDVCKDTGKLCAYEMCDITTPSARLSDDRDICLIEKGRYNISVTLPAPPLIDPRERLTTTAERSLADAASFSNVTDLSLSFASLSSYSRFYPHVVDALCRLTLESLWLTNIGDVSLSAIAKRCRGLECLGLSECVVRDEEIDENTVFQCLRTLRIRSSISEWTFFGLLRSCPRLAELQLYNDALTTAFIVGLPRFFCEHRTLDCIERLKLHANMGRRSSLDGRQELPCDLDNVFALLPALRSVRTDDYRERLRIENCARVVEWVDLQAPLQVHPLDLRILCKAVRSALQSTRRSTWWRNLHAPECGVIFIIQTSRLRRLSLQK